MIGQDFPTKTGTPVYATHDGFLFYADDTNGVYGIRIDTWFFDDNQWWEDLYAHLSKINVPKLDKDTGKKIPIKAGQLIGWSGSTGNSQGPHLHYGLFKVNDKCLIQNTNNGYFGALDPVSYFKKSLNKPMKIYVDKRTNPPTVSVAFTVNAPDNLKWYSEQANAPVPLKPDGTVDFTAIKYDGEIVDEK